MTLIIIWSGEKFSIIDKREVNKRAKGIKQLEVIKIYHYELLTSAIQVYTWLYW